MLRGVLPEMDEIDEIDIDKNLLIRLGPQGQGAARQQNRFCCQINSYTTLWWNAKTVARSIKQRKGALLYIALEAKEKKDNEQAENRKVMVGSGDRSEKSEPIISSK